MRWHSNPRVVVVVLVLLVLTMFPVIANAFNEPFWLDQATTKRPSA